MIHTEQWVAVALVVGSIRLVGISVETAIGKAVERLSDALIRTRS